MIKNRRSFLRGLSMGGAATLLGPFVNRIVGTAWGADVSRPNLFVLTAGNGWGHQSLDRNTPLLAPTMRSESDWDLPKVLNKLSPLAKRVSLCRRLYNPFDKNLHGNGWATLSVMKGDGRNPGGPSLDRWVALQTAASDPFPSLALGVALRDSSPPPCTSSDGVRKPFPAIGRPLVAFETVFGSASGQADADNVLARRKSLLDAMVKDVERVRAQLAGQERTKLDQLLESYRGLERQLSAKRQILAAIKTPAPPTDKQNSLGLQPASLQAHVDVAAHAVAFGFTRVVHLSVLGFDAHNAGWDALGFSGDAHENLAHLSGYDKPRATAAYEAIIDFEAGLLARFYSVLSGFKANDQLLSDQTLAVWVNSGGGKHHEGHAHHAVVIVGDAQGRVRGGMHLERPGHAVSEAFLPVASAMGVKSDTFGDPEHCKGPLPGLV